MTSSGKPMGHSVCKCVWPDLSERNSHLEELWKSYGSVFESFVGLRELKPLLSMDDETVKSRFIDHKAYQVNDFDCTSEEAKLKFPPSFYLSKGESAEVSQQLRDDSSSGYRLFDDHYFGSEMGSWGFADDTGGLSSPTNKFTAHKHKTEFNIPQLHNYQNAGPHWPTILHQEQVAVENKGYESFKELPLQDAEFQASNFQTEKSPPLQEFKEIEDDILVFDDSHQLPLGEDTIHKNKRRLIVGAEKDNSNIHVLDKTCIEETSKEGKSLEKGLSYDILSAHFGTPQDDAAKFFNVSRSTFKRICRDHGIKRWQSKKKLHSQSSSKLRRVNDEELSRTNSYCSGIPPLQAADVTTVKATYKGVAMIFEVPDSSGMVDLEDNVIERLKMERNTFSIKYQDDEGDWILIACDNDLRKCLKTSRLLKKTTVKMLIDRPINHYAS